MATFTPSNASITIFTYKEGLLSKVAHDLQIKVTSFTVNATHDTIRASADTRSLRVEHCMKQGTPDPKALSAGDKRKIESNIVKDVLKTRRFPTVTLNSGEIKDHGDRLEIRGELNLHGQRRTVNITAKRNGERYVAEFWIHQPDYGIAPYKALMGAIKLKPNLKVVVSTPADLGLA